jgi:hypothetical protein
MANREPNSSELSPTYLSKKVLVNGQPVTLYSKNGITWLSSPDEIEDVMARLDNTRILLNDVKGDKPDKDKKDDKSDKRDTGGKEQSADEPALAVASQKPTAGARYRMKGPKPRPILKQDGVAIMGTPVAPISASTVQMKVGDDEGEATVAGSTSAKKSPDKKAPLKREPAKANSGVAAVSKLAKALSKVVPAAKKSAKKGAVAAKGKAPKGAKKLELVKSKLAKPAKKTAVEKVVTKGSPKAKPNKVPVKGSVKGSAKTR